MQIGKNLKENVHSDSAIIPFEANLPNNEMRGILEIKEKAEPNSTNAVQNNHTQLHKAPILFQGATFHNCQITSHVTQ